jgi:serine/threonine-protein kinase
MEQREELAALARAIAERLPVDWESLQSSGDESVRDTARELKVIAEIAALHREAAVGMSDRTWGAFRIVDYVGHGSYGDVYRAIDTRLDREVALKLLRAEEGPIDSLGAAVLQEARLLARVRHPNVVTIYGADRIDGRVGLWMELVEGHTLERILQQDGPLSPTDLAGVCLDVCRALQAVHDAGLLHRDIKAQNVMRDARGRHVLMDFGAGRHAATAGAADITGTPLYIAPEVLEGAPASSRSDIYSVGVLLFHLVTGRYPVEGRTIDELRAKHAAGERLEIRALQPQLPGALVDLIERALARDASGRFDSARAMADTAARILSLASAGRRRPQPVLVAAAVLLLAVAGAGSWLVYERGRAASSGVRTNLLWDDAAGLSGTTSADGRLLSFIDWSTGELGVRDLIAGRSRVFPLPADVRYGLSPRTALSPDGERIAYTSDPSPPGRGGGTTVLGIANVHGVVAASLATWPPGYVEAFSWSPDGRSIVVMVANSDGSGIDVVPVDGRGMRRVASLQGEVADAMTFSPDGTWVAFHLGGRTPAVFAVRADGSSVAPASIVNATALLAWTADGRLLFTRERQGGTELFAVAMADGHAAGEPAKIETLGDMGRLLPTAPGRGMPALGFTAPGTLIYGRVHLATDAVTVSIDPTTGAIGPERVGRAVAGYGIFGLAGGIRYAPDGTRILYTVTQGSVLIQEPDGRTRTIVPQLEGMGRLEWAPDGRSLVAACARCPDGPGIYRVDLESGAASLLVPLQRRPWAFGMAPDGKTLYYGRTGEPDTILARDIRTGVERTVGTTAGTIGQLRASQDGRLLAAVTLPAVEIVDLASGLVVRRINGSANAKFGGGDWSPDAKYVFATVGSGDDNARPELWRIPVDGGEPERHRLDAPARGGWMRADGREFSMIRWRERQQVWSLEHFLH